MDIYPTPAEVLRDALVDRPVLGFRPHAAARAAKWFVDHFPGETLYAVKANDFICRPQYLVRRRYSSF